MIFSHILSGSVLAGTSVGVFWHFFQRMNLYNRLLWGFFLLSIALAALVGITIFWGDETMQRLHHSMLVLSDTLGVVCVVMGVWSLLNRQTVNTATFMATVVLGISLFIVLLLPEVSAFTPIVPSLGILILMLLAVFALLRRDRHAIWIVLAAMAMGLATKANAFGNYIHPTDFDHYASALALWFFGKATEQ
ncbi:DUF6962 family protein [Fibrisoma limi]